MIFTLRFASTASASLTVGELKRNGILRTLAEGEDGCVIHVTSTNLRVSPSENPIVEEESL